jgi:hypothetical protein
MLCSRNGKTISGINFPVTRPYHNMINALRMSRSPNGQRRKHLQNKKRIQPLTIESLAYIRSPDKHILLSKEVLVV